MKNLILLVGLFHLAWEDWKTKLIREKDLLFLTSAGIMLRFIGLLTQKEYGILEAFKLEVVMKMPIAMSVGGILFLIAKFTKEKIGFGDAFVFFMTGVFLDFVNNITLLIGTFFLAGIVAIGCFTLKKKGKNDSMAMMPFTLAAYVLFVL